MNHNDRQLSDAIESVARPLAEWTVSQLAESVPGLEQRYGPKWRAEWVGATRVCLQYLAQAVAVRRPQLFASSVAWTRTAFDARSVSRQDLRTCLAAMQDVLTSELPESVATVAAEHVELAVAELDRSPDEPTSFVRPDSPHGVFALRYLEAILEGKRERALDVIRALIDDGTDVGIIYTEVLQPSMAEIGRLWHLGEISIADEHFGTALTETAMSLLRTSVPTREARGRRLLAAAIGGELHALGVRMVADFFEMDGWEVYLLGANTPEEALVEAVRNEPPDLLALSVISLLNVRALGNTIARLKAEPSCATVPIMVGGPPLRIAPDLWKELGADGCAGSAPESVEVGNRLVSRSASDAAN